ncbi:ABC transporter permease [Chondrinema litorale]|uniref:ABC transporter permease n=1 Tax=Chondrinema litorale TaxID=2994555 RepID=UPI002542E178|nr:ABC transporter permease [Chondrinema litorale]UZR97995.1 ABC transporter permease [Chondrinema litorale]
MKAPKDINPPEWIFALIKNFCDEQFLEEIEGDLAEVFYENVREKGLQKAKLLYLFDAVHYFRPFFFKKRKKDYLTLNIVPMFKNYLLVYLRNLKRQKTQSIINISGLALGLASFALIFLWVQFELSYDAFHTKGDRIYRLAGGVQTESETFQQAVTSPPIGPQLLADFPEVEAAVRFDRNNAVVKKNTTLIAENNLLFTDPSFFDAFDFKLKSGDANSALKEPFSLVLSESMARRYFGDENPIGETITMFLYDAGNQGAEYKITGIVEDCPQNSHIQYEALGSFSTLETVQPQVLQSDGWFFNGFYTYLLLKENVSAELLEDKLPQFINKYMGDSMKQYNMFYEFSLQNLKSIYLDSDLRYELGATGNRQSIWIFASIGFCILLLAIINYVNLSTAISVKKESVSGIRKVLGAQKSHLFLQHLAESVFTSLFALILAVFLMEIFKPLFSMITGRAQLQILNMQTIGYLLLVTIIAGLLSGIYPAIVFSKTSPLNSMKKLVGHGNKSASLRKLLVVCQFVITVFLLSGVLMINKQFSFIKNKDLGLNKENVLMLKVNGSQEVKDKFEVFKQVLLQEKNISNVAASRNVLVNGLGNSLATTENGEGKQINSSLYNVRIDENFLETFGMQIIAGRNLSSSPADSNAFLLNEVAVKNFGWQSSDDAIGKPFSQMGRAGNVVGVVKNFHYNSLAHSLEPVSLFLNGGNISVISVRFNGTPKEALALVEKHWEAMFPASYFDYRFFDQAIQSQYESTERFSQIFYIFSIVCVIIASMGLIGLVAFATEQRKKEISIRKVLGASVPSILWLVSSGFLKLILISLIIAIPFSWIFMDNWLQQFAYHTQLSIWIFVGSGILVVFVAILSGFLQTLKSAMVNPVKNLKSD